jgi:hypothetical protein
MSSDTAIAAPIEPNAEAAPDHSVHLAEARPIADNGQPAWQAHQVRFQFSHDFQMVILNSSISQFRLSRRLRRRPSSGEISVPCREREREQVRFF